MGAARTLLSAEESDNYPFEEDKRYELDEGELIEMTRPAYLHNRVLGRLFNRLTNYFDANRLGEALISENLYALSPSTHAPVPGCGCNPRRQAPGAQRRKGDLHHSGHCRRGAFAKRDYDRDP
jgi:hypothetical protein